MQRATQERRGGSGLGATGRVASRGQRCKADRMHLIDTSDIRLGATHRCICTMRAGGWNTCAIDIVDELRCWGPPKAAGR